ncbi:alpha/beta hydrolase [Ectothiorhodospiraceae bacterium WFHF3C12]|nr:alpha/beta hydrolase [Ectothiorhodospiraceae bacterium WFHF3C12]
MLQEQWGHTHVDGHALRVRRLRHGPGWQPGRPVLVFLHEGLGSIEFWRDFPDRLAGELGLDALVYDRIGHGGSDPMTAPRGADYHEHGARFELPRLLQCEDVERNILVGHSDGATIALLYAAYHGDTVACITEAAHVFVEDVTIEGIQQAKQAYDRGELHGPLARYHGDRTDAVFHAWTDTWLDEGFRSWNIEDRLPGITCPVLVIQGEDDEYGSPAQVHSIVEHTGGEARPLLLPDCGHTPHKERPDAVLRAMAEFLAPY